MHTPRFPHAACGYDRADNLRGLHRWCVRVRSRVIALSAGAKGGQNQSRPHSSTKEGCNAELTHAVPSGHQSIGNSSVSSWRSQWISSHSSCGWPMFHGCQPVFPRVTRRADHAVVCSVQAVLPVSSIEARDAAGWHCHKQQRWPVGVKER